MSTSVASVVSHFPSAENGFTTTTSGSVSSGATTVGLNSVAGYSNGEVAVFVIDPDDTSKKQTFTGTIDTSGVQVTNVVWTAGTNQTHASGATVVDYATATHISMISKGLLVEHDQDGTHSAITGTSINLTGTATVDTIAEKTSANGVTIDGLSIKDAALNTNASVIPNNLIASTGTTWAWSTWSPTYVNITVGNGTVVSKYIQIGKSVFFRYEFTFGNSSGISSTPSFTLPVTAASHTTSFIVARGTYHDADGIQYNAKATLDSTTVAALKGWDAANNTFVASATAPHTWATSDIITLSGFYEAA